MRAASILRERAASRSEFAAILRDDSIRVGFEFEMILPTVVPEDEFGRPSKNEIEIELESYRSFADCLQDRVVKTAVQCPSIFTRTAADPSRWRIVNDSSLRPDNEDTIGAELISPPLVLATGLTMMSDVADCMDYYGAETNSSTGFHVNLSIDGKTSQDYDFLKMILFFDENWTASHFGRLDNKYTKQMRGLLRAQIAKTTRSDTIDLRAILHTGRDRNRILQTLKALGQKLGKLFDKYCSIRDRGDGVFEFRGMGGEDYTSYDNVEFIRKRVVHMAYLLRLGSDPDMLAREYLQRVYDLIARERFDDPALARTVVAPTAPKSLFGFAEVFRKHPDLPDLLNNPADFVVSLVKALGLRRMTAEQRYQLRRFITAHRLSAQDIVNAEPSDDVTNRIAVVMGWPIGLFADAPEEQMPLPFARRGNMTPQRDEQPPQESFPRLPMMGDTPEERRRTSQRALIARGLHHSTSLPQERGSLI